ncbi:hypothetical protein FBU30_009009 [Linnemannia zychae]|nr:hypothetical protein FBU30_009009 [Linnemannia zychae]
MATSSSTTSSSTEKLASKTQLPTYSVQFTATSGIATSSPDLTFKSTIAFSAGYFVEAIPYGCSLVAQGTVSCSNSGKNMLNLSFEKIVAVGLPSGSLASLPSTVKLDRNDEDRVEAGAVRVSKYMVPGPGTDKPQQPLPPPTIQSVQICGEFCTLSSSCPPPTSNTPTTVTATASSTSSYNTQTTTSTTPTGQMLTSISSPQNEAPSATGSSNKSAVIAGSIFAVAIVAFAVGYAFMRRNMSRSEKRPGKKETKQEDIKYTRPMSPASPQQPAAVATAAMTTRQAGVGNRGNQDGGRTRGGRDLETHTVPRSINPLSLATMEFETRRLANNNNNNSSSNSNAATAMGTSLTRGRSIQETSPSMASRDPRPTNNQAGADIQYLRERQRALAVRANTSASTSASSLVLADGALSRATNEASLRPMTSAPTHSLPQSSSAADSGPISLVPMSVTVSNAIDPPVSSNNGPARIEVTRISSESNWSPVDTAELDFLVIPSSSNNNPSRLGGSRNHTPALAAATVPIVSEELRGVDLEDGGYGGYNEREPALTKSRSQRYVGSSSQGASHNRVEQLTSIAVVDANPLRRVGSADNGNSSHSNKNSNSRTHMNLDTNTSLNSSQIPYSQQQQQHRPYRQQQSQPTKRAQASQENLLVRTGSMPRTMTQQRQGGQQQQQQQRADARGLYGYL